MDIFSAIDVGQKIVIKKMIEILKQKLLWYKTAEVFPVAKGANSKTVIFRGFNRLTLALTPLNEGITPAGQNLTMNQVTAVLSQYGDYTVLSDIIQFLADFSMIEETAKTQAIQSSETIDTTIMNIVGAGTNVVYGDGTVSTRATVATTMVITAKLLTRAVRWMERNNVEKFASMPMIGNAYACVMHPDVVNDLRQDTSWISAVNYSSPTPSNEYRGDLFTGELGYWQGLRVISTTMSPVYAAAGASSQNVYGTLVYGKGAYAVSEFSGGLETFIKTGGVQDTGDPLGQRATVGWKWMGTAAILDNLRIVRLETSASLSTATA